MIGEPPVRPEASGPTELGVGAETSSDSGSQKGLTRRKILKRAVGLAAVGAAGGSLLSETFASPASATTTTEQGALAPTVVALTDGPTIAVDASLGNDFRVTINGNRTMENPANPTDGEKVVFQITQGVGGPFTINWGSSYQFSTGLAQPTLSTTAGQTDLLAFIYNATKGTWLLAAFVNGFNSTTVTSLSTYRLFPSTTGPSSPVSYSGSFLAGVGFEVTTGGTWLEGFWWWVCDTGQPTAPQKFALWQYYGSPAPDAQLIVSTTSASLVPGQWNYVALSAPVPLAIGATYIAATGFTGDFPITNNQFGSGQPYSAGIVTGPLSAYSDQSGALPAPFSLSQGLFSTISSDPTAYAPTGGYGSSNFWMDVQVGTQAPTGASYRLWPNYPVVAGTFSNDTNQQTMGTEFRLSQPCTLDNIWFYSPPGATVLPSECAIWNVATQTVVAGTNNTSPAWSGAAGSGWVACPYSGITLPAGDYKTTVYYAGGSKFYLEQANYFGGGGPASAAGIASGPLSAPNVAAASSPGQTTYEFGTFAYPDTYDSSGNGKNRWVDVEVTPT